MKFDKICANDILDQYENGSGWLKKMAARGHGFSKTFVTLWKLHLLSNIHETWSEHLFFIDVLDEIENGSGLLKNMVTRGWGIYPFMAILKPC